MKSDRKRLLPDAATPPGEHLVDTLRELGLSQTALAKRMRRPVQLVNEICRGVKGITAETALQLEDALGISAETWMNLETNYRLTKARLALKRRGARAAAGASPRTR